MALQLSKELATGQSGDYWKVSRVEMQYGLSGGTCTIEVCLFKDSAARSSAKSEMERTKYVLSGADFDTWFAETLLDDADKTPRERAYEYLKTHADFSGAANA